MQRYGAAAASHMPLAAFVMHYVLLDMLAAAVFTRVAIAACFTIWRYACLRRYCYAAQRAAAARRYALRLQIAMLPLAIRAMPLLDGADIVDFRAMIHTRHA